jgi:protein NRD1
LCQQAESVLIQKIFTHFKKTPGTHKLGVLYVVDSVTRKWLEQAKAQAQTINSSAPDGTYAAGVNRVTELMPVLMNDILQSAPEEQKVRISDYHPHVAGNQSLPRAAHTGASCKALLLTTLVP